MLKKLSTFIIMALASNFAQASHKQDHEKPEQEAAPTAKQPKIEKAASQSSTQIKAATSLAASPAAGKDISASSLVASTYNAYGAVKAPTQKQIASAPKTSVLLNVVTGGQKPLQSIILAYLDEWEPLKSIQQYGAVCPFVCEHSTPVEIMEWSPNSKQLASVSVGRAIQIWDAETKELLFGYLRHNRSPTTLAWSPDSKKLAIGLRDGTIQIYDVLPLNCIYTLKDDYPSQSVTWGPDGKLILSASTGGTIKIWNAANGKVILTPIGHVYREIIRIGAVKSVAWSPDGKFVAFGIDHTLDHLVGFGGKRDLDDGDYEVTIWDLKTWKAVRILERGKCCLGYCVSSIAWSPDGKQLAFTLGRVIKIWNAVTGQLERELNGHNSFVHSVAWHPDSKYVVTGSHDSTAKIWDMATGKEIKTLEHKNGDFVRKVTWSANGKYIASGTESYARLGYSTDGHVRIWQNQAHELEQVKES